VSFSKKSKTERRCFFMKALVPICLSLLLLTLPTWGVFYDFGNKAQLNEWEIIGGEWKIENGTLKGENVPAAGGFDHGPGIVVGEDSWTDYTVELKMKMEADKLGGPIIRYIDEQNWYWFEAWRTSIYLRPHVAGEDQAPDPIPEALWDRGEEFQDGEWHTYKIKAQGEDITTWFDGEKILDFTYNNLKWGRPAHDVDEGLLQGKVGLMTWTGDMGEAFFDDVSIEGPGIPGAMVNPNGCLSITWGEIKRTQ